MSNALHLPLQKMLWKVIFLPIFIVIAMFCGINYINELVDQKRQFEYLSQYQAEQMARASEYALLFNDRNLINSNIQSLLRQPDIVGVTYYNNSGIEIESVGQIAPIPFPENEAHYYNQDDSQYISIVPIFFTKSHRANSLNEVPFAEPNSTILADAIGLSKSPQKELLGWIQVSSSTQRLFLENIIAGLTTLGYLIGAALISGWLCWKYSRRISAPWLSIINGLSSIARNEFDKADQVSLPKSMESVKRDLNNISDRLQNYRTELQSEIERITKETSENALQLEEKSIQLHIANKEATESNRLKTQFLANISHEVRTPLNAILGYTNLLKKDELPYQQQSYVETIAQSTNDLLATIGNILDFSKIEAGKTVVLECEDFNLKDIVNEVLHSLSSTLPSETKDIDLIPNFSEDLPDWVKGDKTRLRQILNNLVGNAIKFTQHGTIHIKVNCNKVTKVLLDINIEVVDTGCGIATDKLNQLFKPFSQVDSSHTRSHTGTGLGLVITKKLIEQMGGSIGVTSEPNHGSNFFFNIKLEHSNKKTDTLIPMKESWIVLEPNSRYRGHLEKIFGMAAPNSLFHSSSEQFVADLHDGKQQFFGALICVGDNKMSADEAYELCCYLSNRFQLPYLLLCKPVSYIAQHAQQYQLENHIIHKPISLNQLRSTLNRYSQDEEKTEAPSLEYHPPRQYKHLEGLHILAVDDTPINLQLLHHWLEPHLIRLSLAYSGSEAIRLANEQSFDLILMDIQMPEMDGMEATRQLRTLPNYLETPIIALTAHALAEEQQSILASGMNAYLTKPINEETLLNTLTKWCAAKVNLSQQVDEQLAEVFDVNKALNMAGNRPQAAKDLFEMLMQSLHEDQRLLNHHFANQDLEKLIATVHRIHGASKYSGTIELTKHANFLETHLKELGFDEVEEVFEDFMAALERLKNLQSLIPWPQASQTPEQNLAHPTD